MAKLKEVALCLQAAVKLERYKPTINLAPSCLSPGDFLPPPWVPWAHHLHYFTGVQGSRLSLPVFLPQRCLKWESFESNLHIIGQLLWGLPSVHRNWQIPKAPHESHFLKKTPYSRVQGSCRNPQHVGGGGTNEKTKVGEVKANYSEE